MKLKDALSRFLREHEDSYHTLKTYGAALKPMVSALGPERNIRNVSVMDIKDYAYDLRKKTYRGKPYANSSVLNYENIIKIFFLWAQTCELIKSNPANALKGGIPPLTKIDQKAIKTDELEKLLDYAKWNKRLYALILFLAHTGCRAGGAAGLRVKDVDFERREAVVTEKGRKTRRVLFGSAASDAMQSWLNARNQNGSIDPGQTIFSLTGEPVTSGAVSNMIATACLHAGLRRMGAHAIRHYFGHQAALNGVPASLAATFMGHANPNTTLKVYYPRDLEAGRHLWQDLVENKIASNRDEIEDSPKVIRVKFR